MCTYLHHDCKVCGKEFQCNEPDWIGPTMNYDENAEICKDCEKEYWEGLLAFNKSELTKIESE